MSLWPVTLSQSLLRWSKISTSVCTVSSWFLTHIQHFLRLACFAFMCFVKTSWFLHMYLQKSHDNFHLSLSSSISILSFSTLLLDVFTDLVISKRGAVPSSILTVFSARPSLGYGPLTLYYSRLTLLIIPRPGHLHRGNICQCYPCQSKVIRWRTGCSIMSVSHTPN